jgi:SAM-dependent methyltransferase
VTDDRLRRSFDADPERYDRARPRYPDELLDALLTLGQVPPHGRVLEVGPGTGQLSVGLASRGVRLTAVELGAGLAEVLRRHLAPWPSAQVEVAPFEDWAFPAEPFDLVAVATAWHWLDPSRRIERAVEVLRPGGALALITTVHVNGGDEQFFVDAQDCYLRFDPDTEPGLRLPEDVSADPELETSGRFATVVRQIYRREVRYTAAEFVELQRTYSPQARLTDEAREGMLACLGGLIERSYGGAVSKAYAFELTVATLGK